MKKQLRWKKVVVLLMMCLALMGNLSLTAFASTGTYTYTGEQEKGVNFEINERPGFWQWPGVFKFQSSSMSEAIYAYCAQWGIDVATGVTYRAVPVAQFTSNHERVRSIINHSYPYVSIQTFRNNVGIQTLKEEDAIAASQMAIWNVIQGFEPLRIARNSDEIKRAYQYLIGLAGTAAPQAGQISISRPEYTLTGNTVRIKFSFTAGTKDAVDLRYRMNGVWGFREESKTTTGNTTEVVLSKTYYDIRCIDRFECASITVWGTQAYKDVLVLLPEGDAQPVVTPDIPRTIQLRAACINMPRFNVPLTAEQWRMCRYYSVGDLVSYNGKIYRARYNHISWNWCWNPEWAVAYWQRIQ